MDNIIFALYFYGGTYNQKGTAFYLQEISTDNQTLIFRGQDWLRNDDMRPNPDYKIIVFRIGDQIPGYIYEQ